MRHMIRNCIVLGIGLLFLFACDRRVSVRYHEDRSDRETHGTYYRHVCTGDCDHYFDGPKVVVIAGGHRHEPNCGHVLKGNRWVVIHRTDK
ncbi:MAG: hypothetical protein AABZ47_01045 [Planctomycetota bacterium]|mgnify:CR=1 FL=1